MGRGLGLVLGIALSLGSIGTARAATDTWTGGTSTLWNATGNWSAGSIPANTGTAVFATSVAHSAVLINTTGLQVGEIVFSGTIDESLTGTSADPLTINGGSGGVDINQGTTSAVSIGAAIDLGTTATQIFEDTGTTGSLTFSNQIQLGGKALNLDATNAGNTITVSGTIIDSGSGNVTTSGSGTVIFTGNNTYAGATTIGAGTLQIGNATSAGSLGSGAGNVVDNGSLVFDLSSSTTVSNNISGTGSLLQEGAGTVILTGTNTYIGVTTINASETLQIGNATSTGSLGTGGIVTDNGSLVYDLSAGSSVSNNITGTGALVVNSNTVTLTGTNTYTGVTTIASGATLQLGSATTTGMIANTSSITDNGALVYDLTGSSSYTGLISGTGSLVQESGTLILKHANTYTGDTTISGGTLTVGLANAIGSASDVVMTGNGTLNLNSLNDAVGSLAGSSTNTVTLGSGVLTISDNSNTTFAGVIGGTGGLVMNGNGTSGTLVLTGTNTYSGATNIGANATLQIGNGGTTGAIGNGAITDNGALVFSRSNTYTAANNIGGTGALVQNGNGATGTLILTGTNTYTGVTTIATGATLQIGNAGTTGMIANTSSITDNGALVYDLTGSSSYTGVISGTGSLVQESGTLILKNTNTYTGDTTISGGTLQAGVANAIGSASDVVMTGNGTLNLNSLNDAVGSLTGSSTNTVTLGSGVLTISDNSNTTFAGVIGGTGGLVMNGNGTSGTLVLTGTNTYSGATNIGANATLQIGNGGTTGAIGNGAITDNGALVFSRSNTYTAANNIGGTGALVQNGNGATGTLILTGTNTYTGVTTIATGATLQIGNAGTTGMIANTSSITDNGALVYDLTSSSSYTGVISGTGSLVQESGTLILKNTNTYTGDTTISGGTLQAGVANAIGSASDVVMTGNGTLNLNSLNDAVGSLTGSSTNTVTLGSGVLTISDNSNTTFAGAIGGTGGLVMNGNGTSGTLVLTGTNTYSGATNIGANATLQIGNGGTTGAIGNGAITDNGTLVVDQSDTYTAANNIGGTGNLVQAGTGGTLVLTGTDTYTGVTSIAAGTLQIGNGALGSGSVADSTSFVDNSALTIDDNVATTISGAISGSGTLTQKGTGTTVLTGINTYTGATSITGGALQIGDGVNNGSIAKSTSIVDNTVLAINDTVATTIGGAISGAGVLVQKGAGTTVLTGTNTYTGATSITGGLLQLGDGVNNGSIANSTSIVDNSALAINDTGPTTIGGTISGSGSLTQAGSGTTVLTGGNSSYTGAVTISGGALQVGNASSTSYLGSGNVTDNATLIYGQSGTTTQSASIGGAGMVIQSGTGTTFLTNTNTYSGTTDINAGTLQITNADAVDGTNQINVNGGGTIALSGTVKMVNFGDSLGVLQLNNDSNGGAPATLTSNGGVNSWESDINLKGAATISETAGGLLYIGGGYVNGSQNFNNITLNGNILTLNAMAAPTQTPNYEFNPSGSAAGDAGYYYAPTNIFLNATSITDTSVAKTGGLNITGPGTVTILGESVGGSGFSGPTTVTSGKLIVDGTYASVISSNLVTIGNSGNTGTAILQMGETSEVGTAQEANGKPLALSNLVGTITGGTPNTTMVIYQNGTFDMNNGSEILAGLTMQGGLINEGSYGNSTLLTVFGGITAMSSGTEAVITNGGVGLAGTSFTINVANRVATGNSPDMEIDGPLQDANGFTPSGVATGVIKTGNGMLMLQNDNSAAAGQFDIQGGILAIEANLALGANSSGFQGQNNEAIVEKTAQLELLQNTGTNLDVTNKTLVLNGDGGGTGALLNGTGTNTWAGYIWLNSASTIGASANSSIVIGDPGALGSTIIDAYSASTDLTTTGSGLITIDGGLSGAVGNLIKTGTGTTVLAGIDSYAGATSVAAGALRITNNQSLHGGGVTVANNATLQIDGSAGNVTEVGVATTINGSGNNSVTPNGAIENVAGNNSYGGSITLASASQINSDVSGTNLTMLGGVANGGNLLTVAGAGNTTFTGNMTGGGGLTMSGTGTLFLSNTAGSNNTFSGVTSVAGGGTVSMTQNAQVSSTNTIALAASSNLNVNATTQSVGSIIGNGTVNFNGGTVTLNSADIFNGAFTGAGKIIIPAGASLTLGAGGMVIVGGDTYYDPNLTIELDGGTLNVAGNTNDILGILQVDDTVNPSILNFTGGTSVSSIDFEGNSGSTGGVVITGGATLDVTGWTNATDYFYSTNSPGVRFQMPLNQIVFTGYSGSNTTWLNYSDGPDSDHEITPVPEPSFYGAVVVGVAMTLAGIASLRRRRKLA